MVPIYEGAGGVSYLGCTPPPIYNDQLCKPLQGTGSNKPKRKEQEKKRNTRYFFGVG